MATVTTAVAHRYGAAHVANRRIRHEMLKLLVHTSVPYRIDFGLRLPGLKRRSLFFFFFFVGHALVATVGKGHGQPLENIIDYGYDDTDLYIRLNKAGLNHIIFKDTDTSNQSVIYHKDHSDNDRAINCTNKNIKATLINNQQVAETHPWYKTQVKHMYLIDNDQITIV